MLDTYRHITILFLFVDNKLRATKSQLHPKKLIKNEGKNIFIKEKLICQNKEKLIESHQRGTKGQVKLISLFCNKQN